MWLRICIQNPSRPIWLSRGMALRNWDKTLLVQKSRAGIPCKVSYRPRSHRVAGPKSFCPDRMRRQNSSQPQKIPMLGLIRLRRKRRPFLLLYSRYGSDLCHAAPRNHIPYAIRACEMVIGSLEFGFADGDGLVAVAEFHEVMVRTTAEDDQAGQERQSQLALDFVRTHTRVFFVHGNRSYTVTVALAMLRAKVPGGPSSAGWLHRSVSRPAGPGFCNSAGRDHRTEPHCRAARKRISSG